MFPIELCRSMFSIVFHYSFRHFLFDDDFLHGLCEIASVVRSISKQHYRDRESLITFLLFFVAIRCAEKPRSLLIHNKTSCYFK